MKHVLIFLLLTMLFFSCYKKNITEVLNPEPLSNFTATKTASTFSNNDFLDGDQIGVYIVQRPNAATAGTLQPTGNLFNNKKFTFQSGSMNAAIAENYPAATQYIDIYGYAPFTTTNLTTGSKLSFTVKKNQNISLTPSDLLWVRKNAVSTNTTAPILDFSHKLSKIIIKLTAGTGVTLTTPTVVVKNTLPAVKLNMASGLLDVAEGAALAITAYNVPSSLEYYAIIIPQDVTLLNNFISITNNGKTYDYTLPVRKIFVAGKVYTYNITVNQNDLIVTISGSVTDWGTGDTTTGEAQ